MSAIVYKPTPSIAKAIFCTAGAFIITFAAFVFMDQLIRQEQIKISTAPEVIDLSLFVNKEDSEIKVKKVLPPPPTPKAQPPRAIENSSTTPVDTAFTFSPTLNVGEIGHAPPILSPQDTEATAIIRSEPKYPIFAAREGIEGWVQLLFTITPDGQVTNASVVNAQPKRIFNKEALRAIKRWKYRPKIVNGQAVTQPNQNVVLEFKLSQ
jgi:protein TonB